jgi:hypothetical protein
VAVWILVLMASDFDAQSGEAAVFEEFHHEGASVVHLQCRRWKKSGGDGGVWNSRTNAPGLRSAGKARKRTIGRMVVLKLGGRGHRW